MRVFPVELRPVPPGEAAIVERGGATKRCPHDRIWWADWHDVVRARSTKPHAAQDIFGPEGCPIVAPEDGVVTRSTATTGPTPRGGHTLYLLAASGRTYYFAHLRDAPELVPGDRVVAGTRVGFLGRTGNAATTCPHLHLQATVRTRTGGKKAINLHAELVALDPTRAARRAAAKPTGESPSVATSNPPKLTTTRSR